MDADASAGDQHAVKLLKDPCGILRRIKMLKNMA
jgi:hypothetical protein